MASKRWVVDNWQIPVPLGDCSVHLLIDKTKDAKNQIVHAFIMDGGKPADQLGADEQIERALKAIDLHHNNSTWQFDAWVVTHWDHDHYAGVQAMWNANAAVRHRAGRPFRKAYFKTDKPYLYCGGTKPSHLDFSDFDIRGPGLNGVALLGLDLFTGTQIFDAGGRPKTSIGDPDQPRFCVVGADGRVVGSNKVYKEEKTVSPNESSILAVVYWPGQGGGRTSYFTGGDGNPLAEVQGLEPFLKENQRAGHLSLPQTPVNMVKLDHHGSSKENLSDPNLTAMLLPLLEPVNILVTPGNQYGHPSKRMFRLTSFTERADNACNGSLGCTVFPL